MPQQIRYKSRPFGFVVVFFTLWIATLLAGAAIRPTSEHFTARLMFGDAERLLVWLAFPTLWLIEIERRRIPEALHPMAPWSRRGAIIAGIVLTVILLLGMRSTRGQWHAIPEGHSIAQYLTAFASIALLAIGEEFTFRGVFMSGLIQRGAPFWKANLIVAVVFALSHWPGWLMFGGIPPTALATASLRVLVFGLLMGGLVRLEGGLIVAILVHWFNDVLAGTLF
jgi:membrane protease YdiL (CAAX protease family)